MRGSCFNIGRGLFISYSAVSWCSPFLRKPYNGKSSAELSISCMRGDFGRGETRISSPGRDLRYQV
jgi:hypothetical protein